MSDILEEIQELSNMFSNLFEVEGLGEPASDVPPSTNKIKRDVKTKNGKAELVSVEDELFPYDGDAREQLRKKIISTINGMIQGTKTLEDLLQITRQKKTPLKEAMELLEELLSEGYNLHQVVARAHAKKGHRFFKDNGLPKVSVSPEDIEKEEKLAKILGDKEKTNELAKKALETPDSKEYKKRVSGDARNIFVGGNTDSSLGYKDMVALSHDTNGSRAEERQINKSKGRHYRKLAKMNKSEALEEALEILEEIINEKNANVQKKHDAEINKAEKERVIDREANPLAAHVDEIKRYNQHTIHGLSKFKTGNKHKDWPLKSAISSLASETKNLLGRKYYPENPYHAPYVFGGKYHDLRGNLEQKEYEVKGRGKYHPSNNDHRKEVINTNIERERKIHPNLPKDKSSEALEEAFKIMEEIINEVSKKFLDAKRSAASVKVDRAIARHGSTINDENPEGDSELLKVRQDAIERLKKFDKKRNEYLGKREKKDDK